MAAAMNCCQYKCYVMVPCCRAAAMNLRTVLLSIQALLAAAEPDDPQDAVVARQYKDFPDIFRKTARHWANVYARGMSLNPLDAKLFFAKLL